MVRSPVAFPRPFATLLAAAIALAPIACDKKDETPADPKAAKADAKTGDAKTGDAKAGDAKAGDAKEPAPTTAVPGEPAAAVAAVDLKRDVWVAGFKLTLGAVTHDTAKGELSIAIEAENLTRNDTPIYSSYMLQADGAQLTTGGLAESKNVVALSKVRDRIVFTDVGEGFGVKYDPSKTVLVIGAGTESQARVQLDGKGTADLDNRPVDQAFTAAIEIGQATIAIDKTQIRFDNVPNGATTVEKDKRYLVMTGSWKNNGATALYLDPSRITLTAADGTKSTPDSFTTETTLPETKKDDKMAIVFVLPANYAGDYTLDITEPFGPEGADATATQKLTLAAPAPAAP